MLNLPHFSHTTRNCIRCIHAWTHSLYSARDSASHPSFATMEAPSGTSHGKQRFSRPNHNFPSGHHAKQLVLTFCSCSVSFYIAANQKKKTRIWYNKSFLLSCNCVFIFLMKEHVWKIKAVHLIPVSVSHMERRVQKWGLVGWISLTAKGGYFKIRVWVAWKYAECK